MVLIECPNCRKPIQLVDLRPGRFVPKCPNCGDEFELTVPAEASGPPQVARLEVASPAPLAFVRLTIPESEGISTGSQADLASPIRDTIDRLSEILRRFLPSGLPRGIPRLVDEGHLWVLRQERQGPYGPTFRAIPWCGGLLRTAWFLPPDLGRDPYYSSRWALELIVAAEVDHPNLDPFESIGVTHGVFRSGARAPGQGGGLLYASRVRQDQEPASSLLLPTDPPAIRQRKIAAVVLQAARGLHAAHELGIFHRDVRPENLAVDSRGAVKVVNFGLDSHTFLIDAERQRQASIADKDKKEVKGGQAPLPPIDRRAGVDDDLSALGRTWMALASDRMDLMTVPPGELTGHATSLAKPHADLARKMIATDPEDRLANMGQVVDGLEAALGIRNAEVLRERESLHDLMRQSKDRLDRASNLQLRDIVLRIASVSWGILLFLCFVAKIWRLGLNFLVLGLMTSAWIAAIRRPIGRPRRTVPLLLLESLRGTSVFALLAISLSVVLLLGAAIVYGYLGTWIIFSLLSFGMALAFEIGIGRKASEEWRAASRPISERMAELRLSGLREEVLREWFETARIPGVERIRRSLFDLDSTRWDAATVPSEAGWLRGLHAILGWIRGFLKDRETAHRDRRHRALLVRVEADRLFARGVNQLTAVRRSRRAAKAAMTAIADWRLTQDWSRATTLSLRSDLKTSFRESVWRAIDDPERMLVEHEMHSHWIARRASSLFRTILGRVVRLSAGAAMLALFAIWLDREGIVTIGHVRAAVAESSKAVGRAIETRDLGELRGVRLPLPGDRQKLWTAWNEPLIHREWSAALSGVNLGVAGLILALSAMSGRFLVGLFAILGAAVTLAGPVLTRAELGDTLARNSSAMWLIGGAVVATSGLLIRVRRREE